MSMRIAYLIAAYQSPEHFGRLTRALQPSSSLTLAHVSAAVDETPFRNNASSDTRFTRERISGVYGSLTIIDVCINLANEALTLLPDADYYSFLSGACYPIRPPEEILAFFKANNGREFMDATPDIHPHLQHVFHRLSSYFPSPQGEPGLTRLWSALKRRLPPPVLGYFQDGFPFRSWKRVHGGLVPHCGSSWWTISGEALKYCIDYLEHHPHLYRYYGNVYAPDEILFQTILGSSHFKEQIRHSLTYCDWWSSPVVPGFLGNDKHTLSRAIEGGKVPTHWQEPDGNREVLFARKFNDESAATVEWIDLMLRDVHRLKKSR